jgi:hypothetical protein
MLRAVVYFSLFYCALTQTAAAQDFVAKSRACVDLIRQKTPQTPIRAGATERNCPLPDIVVSSFADAPKHAWLAEGEACRVPLSNASDGQPPPCGADAAALDISAHGLLRIPLSGGRCLHVLPLLLTDTTNGFTCNAVTARTACVRSIRRQGNTTRVKLSTKVGLGGTESEITVSDTIERHMPLMVQSAKGPLFALLPGQYTSLNQERDMPGFLRHVADKAQTACTLAPEACEKQVAEQVNRQAQQMWRRVWNPKLLMTREARDTERNAMRDRIAAGIAEPQAAGKRALMHIIMANEISDSSPSQVLDAVIQNSGLSWGAHQIDIGANDGPEVAMFWDTLRAWRRAPGTGNYPLLRRADTYIACLSQPIRYYFTDQLAILYGAAPDMNKGFRSALARNRYEAHFRTWLGEEVGRLDRLMGLFTKSAFARLYYLDVRNQKGATRGEEMRRFGEAMPEDQLATCAGVEVGEKALVDWVKTPPRTPLSSAPDVDRRVGNINQYLQDTFGPGQGRTCP